MTFSRNQNSENKKDQIKRALRKIARFRKTTLVVEYYLFSVSLSGIEKSPLFKRWIRFCVNKLLVCFLIHNFVIWCVFLFPVFSFCIKAAGPQTCSSRGKSPAHGAYWQPWNSSMKFESIFQNHGFCRQVSAPSLISLPSTWLIFFCSSILAMQATCLSSLWTF